jgi:hypothetical protein
MQTSSIFRRGSLALIIAASMLSASAGDLSPNQWVAMNEPTMGVQMLGWDEIRYCPELEGVLFYGAYRSFTSENQNAIWIYRFKENRWHLLHVNLFMARSEMSSDGGHTSGKMFYDENRKVIVHGGLVSMSTNDRFRTWVFDPRALVGWDAGPALSPGIECDAASLYIPEWKASLQYRSDRGVWCYDANANTWKQLTPPGTGPLGTAELVYDGKRKRVLSYGGAQGYYTGKSFTTNSDVWAYDLNAKTWQKLAAKNPPPPRGWSQIAISPAADVLLTYGGMSGEMSAAGAAQSRNDTWVLKLDTLEWEQLSSATLGSGTTYSNHLAYDPANDVFLLATHPPKGLGYGYCCGMYALKYQGKIPTKPQATPSEKLEYDPKALPKSEGEWAPIGNGPVTALNGWAFRPALTSNGKELLLAFGEYETPGKNWDDASSIFAFRSSGGPWQRLGAHAVSEAHVHCQTPAVAYDSSNNPVVAYHFLKAWTPFQFIIKRFENDWHTVGSAELPMCAIPALAGGKGALAVAGQFHPFGSCADYGCGVFVSENTSSEWKASATDSATLNAFPVKESRAQFVSLQRDGNGHLFAAWQEQKYPTAATAKRIHVSRQENGKWTPLGTEVPMTSPQANANAYAMTVHNGDPVVAVCDAVDGGHAQLLVYVCKGGAWSKLGDALNVLGSDGGAFKPGIASDGKNIFVAWPEFLPGHPPLLFVKKWDGSKWSVVGTALNDAVGKGAATDPVMAVLNGKPVVAWSECNPGSEHMQQIFSKIMK